MRRRLLLGYVLFTLVVVLVLEVPFGIVLVRRENDEFSTSLHRQARTFAVLAEAELEEIGPGDLHTLATQFRVGNGPDLVVLDLDAKVITDTGTPAVPAGSTPFDAAEIARVRLGRSIQVTMQLRSSGPREQVVLLLIGAPGDMHGFVATFKTSNGSRAQGAAGDRRTRPARSRDRRPGRRGRAGDLALAEPSSP